MAVSMVYIDVYVNVNLPAVLMFVKCYFLKFSRALSSATIPVTTIFIWPKSVSGVVPDFYWIPWIP